MVIQIVQKRELRSNTTGELESKVFFTRPKITVPDLKTLFEDPESIIRQLRPEDRWNIFYTVYHSKPDVCRKNAFLKQTVLAFDVDHIDMDRAVDYIPVVAEVLGIPDDSFTVVNSGNGLHFIVQLTYEILEKDLVNLQRHYKGVIELLQKAMARAGLPGDFDMILDRTRILRMPLTENRKTAKDGTEVRKQCRTLQVNMTPHDLYLQKISGLPDVEPSEAISERDMRLMYSATDDEAILTGCEFLKWTREAPHEVREPQGYAALSILARLRGGGEAGRALAREAVASWTDSDSISRWDPDQKIDKALEASGPRLCKSIALHSDKCQSCPYNGKVSTPIAIKGPDFIATQGSGFYTVTVDKDGKTKRTPNYDDLLRAFVKEYHYFYQAEAAQVWVFNGSHFVMMSDQEVKAFAERMFDPKPMESYRVEFLAKVRANRIKTTNECQEFFRDSIQGKINLQNGVYDTAAGSLLPHSPDYGFRYVLPYGYDPLARAPRFEQFLNEITLGELEYRRVLLDFMASTLVPGYEGRDAAFWWLQGSGANGKSRFLEVVSTMLGSENVISLRADDLDSASNARFRMVELEGKLLCIFEELNEKSMSSRLLGLIKAISDGAKITVERKGKPAYQMPNTAKIVFTANNAPVFEDTSVGFQRRFIPIPFKLNLNDPKCPVKADTGLGARLREELPGIFNLALLALRELQGRGMVAYKPEGSRSLAAQMIRDSDSVENWLYHCLEVVGGEVSLPFGDAYQNYISFIENENPVSKKTFAMRLRAKLGEQGEAKLKRLGGDVTRCFTGLRLKADAALPQEF